MGASQLCKYTLVGQAERDPPTGTGRAGCPPHKKIIFRQKWDAPAGYRVLDSWEDESENPDSLKRKILDVIAP